MDMERKRHIPLKGTDKTQGEMVTMHIVGDTKERTSDGSGQPREGNLKVLDGNFHDAGMERGAEDDLMEDLVAAIHDFVETASEEDLASFQRLTWKSCWKSWRNGWTPWMKRKRGANMRLSIWDLSRCWNRP